MMVPEFMRFYGYKAKDCLDEFAITFFSLVNSMYRIQANEALMNLSVTSAAFSGDSNVQDQLRKQSRGLHGIVQEVRVVKGK